MQLDRLIAMLAACSLAAIAPSAAQDAAPDEDSPPQPASLTFIFTNNGEMLPDPRQTKFYIYEPEDRDTYVDWGHANRAAHFLEGVYDLIIRYENDQIVEEIERLEIELTGDIEEVYDFMIPVARLSIDVTSRGIPISTFSGTYAMHRSGKRGTPLVRRRPGEAVTIRPGLYDIEVTYRADEELQSRWLDRYRLTGERHETVDFDSPAARVTMTLRDGYQKVPRRQGLWKVYRHEQHQTALAEGESGETLEIEPGVYDVGLFHRKGGQVRQRWLIGVGLRGMVEREIDMTEPQTSLRVDMTFMGRFQDDGWYSVFPAGQRNAPILSVHSGTTVVLDPGVYDIRCFLGRDGEPSEKWVYGQDLRDPSELHVELGLAAESLQPEPGRRILP